MAKKIAACADTDEQELAARCACGEPAAVGVHVPLGVFCQLCADRVQAGLANVKERVGWNPTPELARAAALGSDQRLEPWALGAVQNGRTAERTLRRCLEVLQDTGAPEKARREAAALLVAVHAAAGGGQAETQKAITLIGIVEHSARFVKSDRPIEQVTVFALRFAKSALPEHADRIDRALLEEAVSDWARCNGRLTTAKWKTVAVLLHKAGIQAGRNALAAKKAWERRPSRRK